jgi:chromosome segregation ATPase
MTVDEIKDDYENIIKELEDEVVQLKKDNKKLLKKIMELEKNKKNI